MQDYNFAFGFVWVQNLVSDTKAQTEGVLKYGAKENILIEEV
jgi:hypothetical protein